MESGVFELINDNSFIPSIFIRPDLTKKKMGVIQDEKREFQKNKDFLTNGMKNSGR
jgi:hypothetical protein